MQMMLVGWKRERGHVGATGRFFFANFKTFLDSCAIELAR
jgi:hypothetical protein